MFVFGNQPIESWCEATERPVSIRELREAVPPALSKTMKVKGIKSNVGLLGPGDNTYKGASAFFGAVVDEIKLEVRWSLFVCS